MRRIRVIPSLLIRNGGLVKSIKFKDHQYVGDPINAVKIFNEKEVDEITILDISATKERRAPNIAQIAEIASEAFMPLGYGGGITKIEEIKEILFNGVEKVILNSSALHNTALLTEGSRLFGAQAIVASIDVQKNWLGKYKVFSDGGMKNTGLDPIEFARKMEGCGVGEILLNSIDRDGTFGGYDLDIIYNISKSVAIPLIAIGGASEVADFKKAIDAGASAVSAGSFFVYQRPHRAVLISYPTQKELKKQIFSFL